MFVSDGIINVITDKTNNKYNLRTLIEDPEVYSDSDGIIDWYIVSQKLHLGTLNNYKNVLSMTFNDVQTMNVEYPVVFDLFIKNYRTDVSNRYNDVQELSYNVNMLRTFVKRCNTRKINEFQYVLKNKTNLIKELSQPLSLNSIVIKYNYAGEVR